MREPLNNLHFCLDQFVEALLKYQAATLQINQAARSQLQSNQVICQSLKNIADVLHT